MALFLEGARAVELRFEEFPQALHQRLFSQITSFTERLEGLVQSDVPRRTGKLASEIVSDVKDEPDAIIGRVTVSAQFEKAGALEYGGTGRPFKVRGHRMRLDHVFDKHLSAPLDVSVAAYSRPTHIIARRFLRGPVEQLTPAIEAGLRDAVDETIGSG